MTFTDSTGIRWSRSKYGRLTELPGVLRVLGDPRATRVLGALSSEFELSHGVSLEFSTEPLGHLYGQFLAESDRHVGADLLIGAHDWTGNLVAKAAIRRLPLPPSAASRFEEWTLNAFTFEDHIYGIPIVTDTVALIRNTDLVPTPPAIFEDVISILADHGSKLALRVAPTGDPFQIWPIYTGAGGSLFETTAGNTARHVTLDAPESIRAWSRIRRLGCAGIDVIDPAMTRRASIEAFVSGKSPILISSGDVLQDIDKRGGVRYDVSPVPPHMGEVAATPFSLVMGAFISATSENRENAEESILHYLQRQEIGFAFAKGVSGPTALRAQVERTHGLECYRKICETATPMPNFPRMKDVWDVLRKAQLEALAGRDAVSVARDAANGVRLIVT